MLKINTYDFLSVVCKELQVSPVTVNAVTRIAYALFPDKIERVNPHFIPNLWVNRVLIELPDKSLGIVDARLWHKVYYYLVNFSGTAREFYQYDINQQFEDWFKQVVDSKPEMEILNDKGYDDVPDIVDQDYLDINNRLLISIYVVDSFGSSPRKALMPPVSKQEIDPPV